MTDSTLPYAVDYHTPIMVQEVLHWLSPQPGGVFLDATLGGGGHTHALLDAAPDVRVHAIDRDPDAIAQAQARLKDYGERFTSHQCNYSQALEVVERIGHKVDGVLLDAGVSSHQLNDPARGFSFMREGPLDMRMGQQGPSALEVLQGIDHPSLSRTLRQYGELQRPTQVATALLDAVGRGELETTTDLRALVERVLGSSYKHKSVHPATLVFQALRIHVNDELSHLSAFIESLPQMVRPGGHVVVLSFHSLEDRIVKQGFRSLADGCVCPPRMPVCGCGAVEQLKILTKKPIRPTLAEVEQNPRARSTMLRAARML